MNGQKTHLDLFSGIGGFALAARNCGVRTVAFCEIEPYCKQVLKKNFGAVMGNTDRKSCNRHGAKERRKNLDGRALDKTGWNPLSNELGRPSVNGPLIHSDIRKLDGRQFAGVWLLTGGFPCQPFSVAGKRRGKKDDRHLWPEMLRVISESKPAWVLGENVAGFIPMELDHCISDLETLGYTVQPIVIPACAVDAKHRRDRVWIIAHHAERGRCTRGGMGRGGHHQENKVRPDSENQSERKGWQFESGKDGEWGTVPNSHGTISKEQRVKITAQSKFKTVGCRWPPEPGVGRVVDGVPRRVGRLKGLGNAVVPQVAEEIIKAMINAEL
jgi:DNA (cytosine-5)-methyltransferase 1